MMEHAVLYLNSAGIVALSLALLWHMHRAHLYHERDRQEHDR